MHLCRGGVVEKPTDERDPQSAAKVAREHARHAHVTQERFNTGNEWLHCVRAKCQNQAHEGACDRDKKLGDCTGWFRPNLGDPAEAEQRDAAHRNLIPERRRPLLKLGGIVTASQHPGEQREDQKPGIIQTNGDSWNPA